jgi:hypothetical protein
MPDKFTVNKELRLIEIRSYGIVTQKDIEGSLASATEVYKRQGISKVIVDATGLKEGPGTVEVFKMFSAMPRYLSQAIITTKDHVKESELIFAENVAVNRGISLRIFYSREDALKWLYEQ